MLQNIKTNNVKALDLRLYNDNYFDFMLYKGEVNESISGLSEDGLIAYFDMDDSASYDNDGLVSTRVWDKAINEGIKLSNIGLTAVDNGLIWYKKDEITNFQFYDLFLNTTLSIESADTRLHLYKAEGNAQIYDFWSRIEENQEDGKFLSLRGGFVQGFFKTFGADYEVLPSYIDNDWHIELTLRKRSDYITFQNILNNTYSGNAGTFFYIGTRAENKFGEIYNGTYKPSFSGSVLEEDFYKKDESGESYFREESGSCICDDYLFNDDLSLSGKTIITTNDHPEDERGYYEIRTDNKFIFFNRTEDGFNVNNWDENNEVVLTGKTRGEYKENPFLLFHRAESGLSVTTIDDYLKETIDSYDIENNISENAFSLRLTQEGKIAYKYIITDCDNDLGYKVEEEESDKAVITDDKWHTINARFAIIDNFGYDACDIPVNLGQRKMKIYIYLDGYLTFVSKELPEFRFRELDDVSDKQEGVPYNISVGGGTLGLGERIWMDYYQLPTNHYEIEKQFAGTFIGDIKSFKFYNKMMDLQKIKNNYKFERDN